MPRILANMNAIKVRNITSVSAAGPTPAATTAPSPASAGRRKTSRWHIFSGEAYNVEVGVTNEMFNTERDQTASCQFNSVPEDGLHFDLDGATMAQRRHPLHGLHALSGSTYAGARLALDATRQPTL